MTLARILLFLTLTSVYTGLCGQGMEFFEGDFNEAKEKAKTENKYLFVDCYTTWCKPCAWLSKNVFTDSVVGVFYNKEFINWKVDMEKGEGKELRKIYQVNAFPTLLFLNSEGRMVHRIIGACDTAEFVRVGKRALSDSLRFGFFHDQYLAGNRSPEFLAKYAMECLSAGMPYAIKEYFDTQADSLLYSEVNLTLTDRYTSSSGERQFVFLVKHRDEYITIYGSERINNRIYQVLYKNIMTIMKNKDQSELSTELARLLDPLNLSDSAFWHNRIEMARLRPSDKKEEIRALELAVFLISDSSYEMLTIQEIGVITQAFLDYCTDKDKLNQLISFLAREIEVHNHSGLYYHKARVLAKTGDKKAALELAGMALEISKKDSSPGVMQQYEEYYNELQNGEKTKN